MAPWEPTSSVLQVFTAPNIKKRYSAEKAQNTERTKGRVLTLCQRSVMVVGNWTYWHKGQFPGPCALYVLQWIKVGALRHWSYEETDEANRAERRKKTSFSWLTGWVSFIATCIWSMNHNIRPNSQEYVFMIFYFHPLVSQNISTGQPVD